MAKKRSTPNDLWTISFDQDDTKKGRRKKRAAKSNNKKSPSKGMVEAVYAFLVG